MISPVEIKDRAVGSIVVGFIGNALALADTPKTG